MMREIDQLLPLTAWRLLAIWRETRELAEEPLERGLLCNAQVLAESCRCRGEPVFRDAAEVLEQLTANEMETLLYRLAEDEAISAQSAEQKPEAVNPAFDQKWFYALKGR